MPRKAGRVEACSAAEARVRLRDAQAQLEFAELADANSTAEERKASVACAVVCGIAAGDAACCAALRERSRGPDHRQAAALLRRIGQGGEEAARHFDRLIGFKDAAQYGFDEINAAMLTAAQRHARALVEFGADVVAR